MKNEIKVVLYIVLILFCVASAMYGKKVGMEARDDFYQEYVSNECYCPNQLVITENKVSYTPTVETVVEEVFDFGY